MDALGRAAGRVGRGSWKRYLGTGGYGKFAFPLAFADYFVNGGKGEKLKYARRAAS